MMSEGNKRECERDDKRVAKYGVLEAWGDKLEPPRGLCGLLISALPRWSACISLNCRFLNCIADGDDR
jgi:hypothetical protein